MEHTLHKWYLPLWCTVWEFLIAFSEAACHRKIPLQRTEKKSWWAVHKHHRYYVNQHVNMYINPCHPMCTHQTAIRASIKGANLQRAGCGLHLPSLSLLCSPLWFLLQLLLLMSLPASDRPWWTGPGRCAGLQGGAPNRLPLTVWDWRFPERPQKSREERWSLYGVQRKILMCFHWAFSGN